MSIVEVPPPVDKSKIERDGTEVTITKAYIGENIYTSIGRANKALLLRCKIEDDPTEYSYMFSLDRDVITGSCGRILAKARIKHVSEITDTVLKRLEGKTFMVINRAGKLYWY